MGPNSSDEQDDFWRRNYNTVPNLKLHETDFNPHYPTSVAYTPLPRAALEAFLNQRGLLGAKRTLLYPGFLNKIYIRLYDIVYHNSRKVRTCMDAVLRSW